MDSLNQPLEQLKGVGSHSLCELHALGLFTIADLIRHFPFRYDDFHLRALQEIHDKEKVTLQGSVASSPMLKHYRNKTRLSVRFLVNNQIITGVWFNRSFLKDQLHYGRIVTLMGKWDSQTKQILVAQSAFPDLPSDNTNTLQPVYSIGGHLTQRMMRKWIATVLAEFGSQISEILPSSLLKKHSFIPRKKAFFEIHCPSDAQQCRRARQRLSYEELFLFQFRLQAFRLKRLRTKNGISHSINPILIQQFVESLPFVLTPSQKKVINEIFYDMQKAYQMNRLLQGDVGSGKTIVAAVALFITVRSGFQGALMVPTEILAEQHYRSLKSLFSVHDIQVELLTGKVSERKRGEVLSFLKKGEIDILVGTQALLQDNIYFSDLGLIVTDEQHRFGVNQRINFRRKGLFPDVLTMTATPIPRTLAITLFGDLDVSTLEERPKGRLAIKTYVVSHRLLDRVCNFIKKEALRQNQTFFVCPLIEQSQHLDVQNVLTLYETLVKKLDDLAVGLLHGQMQASEKENMMHAFVTGKIDVLVSTTVIEVGVDVPNASLMIVMDADRFGLSQLHQLRGRVGRGEQQSYCILIADPKTITASERLKAMLATDDGFEISRRDLKIRGPGEFFGTKQSGLPEFKLACLSEDMDLMYNAREDVHILMDHPHFWTSSRFRLLREYIDHWQDEETLN